MLLLVMAAGRSERSKRTKAWRVGATKSVVPLPPAAVMVPTTVEEVSSAAGRITACEAISETIVAKTRHAQNENLLWVFTVAFLVAG